MKNLLLTMILLTSLHQLFAQKSVDALFEKYSGRDGFVTMTISGDLLKLACEFDGDDDDLNRLAGKITEIRLLVQDEDNMKVENFYQSVMSDLNLSEYEEYMRVKNSDQDLRMLVKTRGSKLQEFLLIGGGEDNLIVQVKGELTMEDAEKLSADLQRDKESKIFRR